MFGATHLDREGKIIADVEAPPINAPRRFAQPFPQRALRVGPESYSG
jgi:hypothetical protein